MTEGVDGPEAIHERALALENTAGRATSADEAVDAWLELAALRKNELQDVEGSISALRRAIQVQPGHRTALNRYAQACAVAERWSELVDVLELSARAARSRDERARVLAHRGDVLGKKLGRIAEARSMYRDVVRLSQDESLVQAAREAVERIDGLLGQQRSAPRERTFVGRLRAPSMDGVHAPPPGSDRPSITEEKVDHHNRAARLALEEGRRIDARAWVEQALAMRPWNPTALTIRHDILRSEGRWDDLIKLLVVESEEAPNPGQAAQALREAADTTADALGDFDGAIALHRRALDYPGQEEAGVGAAMRLALRHRRLDAAQKLWIEMSPVVRAERLEQLASAISAAGDPDVAMALRAAAFDDRPADVGFFQARLQVLAKLGDVEATEVTLVRRLGLVTDHDERRALTWELSALCESRGRWREALEPLLELVVQAQTDDEVSDVLAAVERLAAGAHDRTHVVRALEAASQRPRGGKVAQWLTDLARLRRDELLDIEGAETAFARAVSFGADVKPELDELRAGLTAVGADSILAQAEPLSDDTIDSSDTPLVMGVDEPTPAIASEPPSERTQPGLQPVAFAAPAVTESDETPDLIPPPMPVVEEPSLADRLDTARPALIAAPDDGEGGAVPIDVAEATTDAARAMKAAEEVTDSHARVALPTKVTSAPPPPRPGAHLDVLADAIVLGEPIGAARWLAAGRRALLAGDPLNARSCFERALDGAKVLGVERIAAALIDGAWVPESGSTADVPEVLAPARTPLRMLELGRLGGRALAVRAAEIARMWGADGSDPIEETWLETAARADPHATDATAILYARALSRGDRSAAREWLSLGLGAPEPGAKWWLRAADLEAAESAFDRSAAALQRALEASPLDVEPARRLAELGAEALEITWLAEGLAEMRDRYLWARSIRRAAVVSLVRLALGVDDPGDGLLVDAVRLERDSAAPQVDPELPEERRVLEAALATADVEAVRASLDPSTDAGRRRLLLVLSPPFLLADLP